MNGEALSQDETIADLQRKLVSQEGATTDVRKETGFSTKCAPHSRDPLCANLVREARARLPRVLQDLIDVADE